MNSLSGVHTTWSDENAWVLASHMKNWLVVWYMTKVSTKSIPIESGSWQLAGVSPYIGIFVIASL